MIDSSEVKLIKGRGKQKAAIKVQKTIHFNQEVRDYFESDKAGWQKRLTKGLKLILASIRIRLKLIIRTLNLI